MDLSQRLVSIEKLIPKCSCLADVGTDHAYIPILAVTNGKCSRAIASDINKGPVLKAEKNIMEYSLKDKIETRLGPGLSVLSQGEADVIVIAGMGGNLIRDILVQDIDKAKSAKMLILQPMQNQDVLRKDLSSLGFSVLDEELVKEDRRYYHIIMASSGRGDVYSKKSEYILGKKIIEKSHPLLKDYIKHYNMQMRRVLGKINPDEQKERYDEVTGIIREMEEVEKCL